MKLQIAFDGTLDQTIRLLETIHTYVDIIEIGTPLILREGVRAVQTLRAQFPQATLLADLKIMDAGCEEAEIALAAGADFVTVLGVAADSTVSGVVAACRQWNKQVLADLVQVPDAVTRARQLQALGCDYICLHTAYDAQPHDLPTASARFAQVRQQLEDIPLAVAGGIKLANIDQYAALQPAIIVVGQGVTGQSDPLAAIRQIKERLR